MSISSSKWAPLLVLGGTSIAVSAAYALTAGGRIPAEALVVIAVIAGGMQLLWFERSSHRDPLSVRTEQLVWIAALLAHLSLVASTPILSDDIWRYLFDGQMQASGLNPYAYAPASPKVADIAAAAPGHVNHPQLRTLYPPFAQWIFGTAGRFGSALLWKSAMLAALVGLAAFMRSKVDRRASLFTLCSPLFMLAVSSEGHVDIVGVLLLTLASMLTVGTAGRALLFTGSVATKLFPAVLLPAMATAGSGTSARKRRLIVFVSSCAAFYILFASPYLSAGAKLLGATTEYAGAWSFNGAIAPMATSLLTRAIELGFGRETFTLPLLEPLYRLLGLSSVYAGEITHARWWDAAELARLLYRFLSATFILVFAIVQAKRTTSREASLNTLFAFFLLSPVVHPWYVCWLVPLSFSQSRVGFVARVWSVTVVISYLVPAAYLRTSTWMEPAWLVPIEYGALVVAFFVYPLAKERKAESPGA